MSLYGARDAGADGELSIQISNVDESEYPMLRFLATVVNADGFSPGELTAANLSVRVGDREIPVSSVKSIVESQIGISALLAIDTSGSMSGSIISAQAAADSFIAPLGPADELALVSFADQVVLQTDFTKDLATAQQSLQGLAALGNTALYQAVSDSAHWVQERTSQRRVVVLLSDGADYGGVSAVTRTESLQAAGSAGVPFYVVGLGAQIDQAYLEELAAITGGALFVAPTLAELDRAFSSISQQVLTQYVVALDLKETGLEGNVNATVFVSAAGQSGSAPLRFAAPAGPIVIPREVQLPVTPEEPGTSLTWLPLAVLVLLLGGTGAVFGRRAYQRFGSGRDSGVPGGAALFRHQLREGEDAAAEEVLGRLVGPDGETFNLTRDVVTFGADAGNTYRLPVSGLGETILRVWLANERYVIHDTSARPRIKLNGRVAKWATLSNGDRVEIGGLTLRFESMRP